MNEKLLHLIWQFRYYNPSSLQTTSGERLQVIHPGQYNRGQGPDFLNARIRVGETVWAGHVELHCLASDWIRHGHTGDPQYENVILHVVWEEDVLSPWPFPSLELNGRVPKMMMEKCRRLIDSKSQLPCAGHLESIGSLNLNSWKERLLAERLLEKSNLIRVRLNQSKGHWGEVFWQCLARSYGLNKNGDCFERMAESLPVNRLRRIGEAPFRMEALLFGQASLLEHEFSDEYPIALQKEYRFLSAKHDLKRYGPLPVFLRMRPASFPTLRLAQLASLLRKNRYLFSVVMETQDIISLKSIFDVPAGEYWNNHYVFDEPSAFSVKRPGEHMLNSILINTVVPVIYAYGLINSLPVLQERALEWLDYLPAEKNAVTAHFTDSGLECLHASDSQSLLQLNREYCCRRKCLECAIGLKVLGGA